MDMKYWQEYMGQRMIQFLTAVVIVSFIAIFLTPGHERTWLALLTGIVLFVISEYIVHRYLLHEFPRLMPGAYQGHVAHHEHPNDVEHLFGSVWYDVASYIVYFAAALLLTGNLHLTVTAIFGASLTQWYYQWKHYVSHRPIIPWSPWGKYMKKKHLLHHHKDEHAWYGVSNPLLDIVMGTNQVSAGKSSKAASPTQRRA